MNNTVEFGKRLSGEEYDRKIVRIYENLPDIPSPEMEREAQRKELNLTIDYRLGCEFPADRREALWKVHQLIDKKRLRLMFSSIFRKLLSRKLSKQAQGLANYVVSEYAKVLNQDELKMFFGEDEVRNPRLPIDLDRLEK